MSAALEAAAEAVRGAAREGARLVPVAGGTKRAVAAPPGGPARALELGGLSGVVEYDPAELTFTAGAATPLAEIDAMLAANGQHLPFDPPRLGEGGTIGGAVAAGVTGPCGFGAGVRDFVVGVRVIDGTGRVAAGGGRVVKNAAGFDLPKLMVGSLGRLGVLAELSLKVFPRPHATATVRFPAAGLAVGLEAVAALARGPLALCALDLDAEGAVTARIGGDAELIGARAERLAGLLEPGGEPLADEAGHWERARRFEWVGAGERLVVVPLAPRQVPALDGELGREGLSRRYGLAANVAWIGWPRERTVAELSATLAAHRLGGLALTGPPLEQPLLGIAAGAGGAFGRRVAAALDPAGVFGGAR